MAAIGIDLGTTNCCVAVERNGIIKVIPQSANTHTTPSYVSFWNDEILFGSTAKQRLHRNVENTVYDIKRIIGRNVSDVAVQSYINRWGFKVIEDEDDKLKVVVKFEGSVKKYTPEELSGLILKDLKSRAESFLDTEVNKAVITVPSYFNDAQRHATVDAGKIAGFQEVKLLNEPTAAAIAYSVEHASDKPRTIFVFDFGGGTFDVSVIKFKNNIIDVLAIDGNLQLGGNDIDNLLLNYVKNKYTLDIDKSKTKLYRLKHMCEDIKKQLSEAQDTTMEIIEMGDRDIDATITREEFNKLNDVIYQETIEVIERCLDRIKMNVKDIDDIILIGGSTKIRKVVEMLEKFFKKPLKRNINPDEAVAIGAAVVASSWGIESVYKELQFNDICPYSIGIEVQKGKMSVIIPRFTKLPASSSRSYYTSSDKQEIIRFTVVAGENYLAKNNFCVANLLITGFEIGPAHSVQFLTTFEIDKNGILTVAVLDCSTGTSKEFTVKLDKGRLTKEEIKDKVSLIDRIFGRKKK